MLVPSLHEIDQGLGPSKFSKSLALIQKFQTPQKIYASFVREIRQISA